jgi:hypothetical protein
MPEYGEERRSTGTDPNFAFGVCYPTTQLWVLCKNPTPQHTHVIKDIKSSTQYSWATVYVYIYISIIKHI